MPSAGVDAELVRLDVPRLRAAQTLREARAERLQQRVPTPACATTSGAIGSNQRAHAAVQRVVFHRLPVRAVRRLDHTGIVDHETGMAAPAVAAAVLR